MSLARRRRPSWSVCSWPRAACSLAMILGKPFSKDRSCPLPRPVPQRNPDRFRVRSPPQRDDTVATIDTIEPTTMNRSTRYSSIMRLGRNTTQTGKRGQEHGYVGIWIRIRANMEILAGPSTVFSPCASSKTSSEQIAKTVKEKWTSVLQTRPSLSLSSAPAQSSAPSSPPPHATRSADATHLWHPSSFS